MRLLNLYHPSEDCYRDTGISEGKIVLQPPVSGPVLSFENALVFPGIINSHDHLDFNLFPQLGNRIYPDYISWGKDIHSANRTTIDDVLKVPAALRIQWGMYKNLLCGITTVVNHGPRLPALKKPLNVFEDCQVVHSAKLERYWKLKINLSRRPQLPIAIHCGEGTLASSGEEIGELLRWNLWNRKLIGIHAVAMSEAQAKQFRALVWCPASNHFLLGKTAPVNLLKKQTAILFGTDSTVSANWNIWDHLRLARQSKLLSDEELWNSLFKTPALVWPLPEKGSLNEGMDADLVVARKEKNVSGMDSFFRLNPEDLLLIMQKGEVSLFDAELLDQLKTQGISTHGFSLVKIAGCFKYVKGDLAGLMNQIRSYNPGVIFPAEPC